MALISYTPITDGSTAVAAGINTPLSTIYNDYNGNITNANIASGAAIAGSKINYASVANPYKFSVYRTTALNSPTSTFALIPMDTKTFDTSTNVDVVTNKGRFTAPIAGFYWFSVRFDTTGGNDSIALLYKNGSQALFGSRIAGAAEIIGVTVSGCLQLAANDYVEPWMYTQSAQAVGVGVTTCYFHGFLISAT